MNNDHPAAPGSCIRPGTATYVLTAESSFGITSSWHLVIIFLYQLWVPAGSPDTIVNKRTLFFIDHLRLPAA
ncbi:TPA: hypothetical protein P2989_002865 [Salmonella enterica subsp. enterica serovar Typhimurium]|nr:hypothetical protein [Salmonella enterica subsp. enterica serovar Typhimurium]